MSRSKKVIAPVSVVAELIKDLKAIDSTPEVLVPEVTVEEIAEISEIVEQCAEIDEIPEEGVVEKENDMLANAALEVAKLAVVKRRCVSTVAKLLILEGFDNAVVFEMLDNEFKIGVAKKSYPSWYRNDLIKKGILERSVKIEAPKAKKVVEKVETVAYEALAEESTY